MNVQIVSTGSKGNCYIVRHDEDMLMIDAGLDMNAILRAVEYKPTALQGVLVSHMHLDHAKSLKRLVQAFVEVYASKETFDSQNIVMAMPNVNCVDCGTVFSAGKWLVTAFETEHDAEGSLGFYFTHTDTDEKILYVTDTGYVKVNPSGVTCLMIECNYIDSIISDKVKDTSRYMRLNKYHMSLERVLSYLESIDRSSLHTIILLHMSDLNSNEEEMIKQIKDKTGCQVYSASDGMNIPIGQVPF